MSLLECKLIARFGSTIFSMRRIWATLLLAISAFSLIAPALSAVEAESTLPACCRRNGRHHCTMGDQQAPGGGIQVHAARCALFPTDKCLPATGRSLLALSGSAMVFAAIVAHPAVRRQTASLYRISYSRAGQKRGPPSLS